MTTVDYDRLVKALTFERNRLNAAILALRPLLPKPEPEAPTKQRRKKRSAESIQRQIATSARNKAAKANGADRDGLQADGTLTP